MFPDITRDDVFRLETRRLWLRWPRATDAVEIARLAGDKDVAYMTARLPYPYGRDAAERFILDTRASNAGGRGIGLIITKKHKPMEPIGAISFRESPRNDALLGFWLGKPYWGNGLATEAAQGMIDTLFTLTQVREVRATTRVINPSSRRVLEKCGFAYEGSGLELLPARGGMESCDRFRLDRKAWASLKGWSMPALQRDETGQALAG
ncbi:GNAT family N-acetyltransferase [Methylovirgula sp. 4M-Z18]|uniref:GNAT family N-acetyltransferase n=1 Tax=Methylovirgula sp. 4M-Z18 TaxID=2293567 RepID=UPI000E2E678B|nr:GNAT family N-acetyltransferase [Methylovirgula sp. 4M-Z18]RFB78097.1 N-acetyltransferase [Methylovirgula sp. 4M-Z18]